jgi:hypothetical protein
MQSIQQKRQGIVSEPDGEVGKYNTIFRFKCSFLQQDGLEQVPELPFKKATRYPETIARNHKQKNRMLGTSLEPAEANTKKFGPRLIKNHKSPG